MIFLKKNVYDKLVAKINNIDTSEITNRQNRIRKENFLFDWFC